MLNKLKEWNTMTIEPQVMLIEERGLENQIKRLNVLIPSVADIEKEEFIFTVKYLQEQLTTIVEDLEDIKLSIKSENDRVLTNKLKGNK